MSDQAECKFAIHIPSNYKTGTPDYHLIKEAIHHPDGTITPNLRFVKDFKRPFYITKKSKQTHKQKKEWEHMDNVLTSYSTQSDLKSAIAKQLDRQWSQNSLRELCSSPFVYGSDLTSTAIIKYRYQKLNPQLMSKYNITVFDIETDVINGTEQIIAASVAYEDKSFTVALSSFVRGISSVQERFIACVNNYISEYVSNYVTPPEFAIANDEVELIRLIFNKVHEWKPDFLAIWNINFDLPRVLTALQNAGVDPKDILSDPAVPKDLRICKYKQGPLKKITSSGKVTPISPADQWHTLTLTSSFFAIDAMCAYKRIRSGQQEESSYSLDAILNKELGIRKLKFKEADEYTGLRWHQVMQERYKIEYLVYNLFDCISMIHLDNKTKDLSYTLPTYSGISDFYSFKSQPKRITDNLEIFCNDRNHVLGTVGPIDDDDEAETLDLKNWILTLPAYNASLGMACLAEDPTIKTGIRCHAFDSDAVSAYPSCASAANVSKETTKREIVSIGDIPEEVFRAQNLNFLLGHNNDIQYCTHMLNFTNPVDLLRKIHGNINNGDIAR